VNWASLKCPRYLGKAALLQTGPLREINGLAETRFVHIEDVRSSIGDDCRCVLVVSTKFQIFSMVRKAFENGGEKVDLGSGGMSPLQTA